MAGIAGILLAVIGLRPGSPKIPPQAIRLTNGVTLRLESVQFGAVLLDPMDPRSHGWRGAWSHMQGALWKLAPDVVPPPMNWNPFPRFPTLGLWFSETGEPLFNPRRSRRFEVIVEPGDSQDTTRSVAAGWSGMGAAPSGGDYQGVYFTVFPRRCRELRVAVYDAPFDGERLAPSAQPLHTFRLPNPAYRTRRDSPALPTLPVTVREGDFEGTVLPAWTNLASWASTARRERLPPEQVFTRFGLQLRHHGTNAVDWRCTGASLYDQTGNRCEYPALEEVAGTNGNRLLFLTHPAFPKGEPTFARLELSRTAGFDTNAICVFTNVVIGIGAPGGSLTVTSRDGRYVVRGAAHSGVPDQYPLREVTLDFDRQPGPAPWVPTRTLLVEARPSGGGESLNVPVAAFERFGRVRIWVPRGVTNLDLRIVCEPVRTLDVPLPAPDVRF
jgi:hypothetical protein